MNRTWKEKDISTNFLLGLFNSLPLPVRYKTDHLLDKLIDLPTVDLPAYVEPVSSNAINVQTKFMPSADVLPWHPNDDDSGYQNRECWVKRIKVNMSKFTSNIYPDSFLENKVFIDLVFTSDDIDVPGYNSPTKVNLLDTGAMHNYWWQDPDVITVNVVEIDKDDPTVVCGQFDSGADATVANLLIYLHDYKQYNTKFKCPVKLTGAIGTKDIHPLGEGFLHLPASTPSGFLTVCYFYSPQFSSTLVSPWDILNTFKDWRTEFNGQDIKTYFGANGDPNFGRCTLACHSNLG